MHLQDYAEIAVQMTVFSEHVYRCSRLTGWISIIILGSQLTTIELIWMASLLTQSLCY